MLTYDLAKKLKDAGFPQDMDGAHWEDERGRTSALDPDGVFIPTLEELIEACGEKFGGVERCYDSTFYAKDFSVKEFTACFPTPTEAVANLWLKLHENKSK